MSIVKQSLMRRSLCLTVALSVLMGGCARMTVKTHKEHGAQCTQTVVAPLVDVVTTIPILGYAGAFVYVGLGFGMGPLVFVIAAPLVAAGTYTTMSATYGFKETAKCRKGIDERLPPTK
jgi:hypothetical protein